MTARTRKLVMPADLNGSSKLFGGRALSWIDEEAAIFAMCKLLLRAGPVLKTDPASVVTAHMSEVNFVAPAALNDVVEIDVEELHAGNKSFTVKAELRNKTTGQTIVSVDKIVFVTLDHYGNPTKHYYQVKKVKSNG